MILFLICIKYKRVEILFLSQEKLREENNMNYLMRSSQTKWFMWLSDDIT